MDAEGVYSDHPRDRGGRTKYGVTEATFKAALQRGIVSGVSDVRDLTREQAIAVFRAFFWDAIRLDKISDDDIAGEIFDTAVNSGPATAVRIAQLALEYLGEKVQADGVMGPKTISLLNKWCRKDPRALYVCLNGFQFIRFAAIYDRGLIEQVMRLVKSDPSQAEFTCGWTKRIQQYNGISKRRAPVPD
ncbi:MAG: glycosyl hydrolase 108 family protein [Syntrophales bacterium]